MLDLSPTKLLIILVVAVVLLGPKRLPQLARQLGTAWRRVRELTRQIDHEVRQSIPDLPSSHDLVRFARSPATLLDQLADLPPDGPASPGQDVDPPGSPAPDPARTRGPAPTGGLVRTDLAGADDPSLN